MHRINTEQPVLRSSVIPSFLPSSTSVCHRLVRLLDDESAGLPPHDREFLNQTFLQLSGTGMLGWYYTSDFADGSRLTVDQSVAGQVTVTAYRSGMPCDRRILTPVHPLWKDINSGPAKAKLIREWRDWAAMPAPGEQREKALRIVTDCVVRGETELLLDALGLTSLPTLPDSITELDVSWNRLTTLPALPDSLTELDVSWNQLTTLPVLPTTLNKLNAWNNQLTALPDLPDSLTDLIVSHNRLTTLPALTDSLTAFNASGNQLTTLPDLPDSLTVLNVSDNHLTALPTLPDSLTDLNVSDNWLTTLPALIDSLIALNVGGNQLTALPNLPDSLTALDVSDNQLTALPDLPDSLTLLCVSDNRLSTLPALTDSLTALNVGGNLLTALPELPDSLIALDVSDNRLATLPVLNDSLETLNVSGNVLTVLPELPDSLTELDVSSNQLTTLPALPDSLTELHIARNWLTTLPPLPALLEGRDIGFGNQRSALAPAGQPLSLPDSITRWYPAQRQESVRTIWTPRAAEENAASFTEFLNKLNENICARSPVFRERVAAWLDELVITPELRTLSFAMAQEASTSCTDRAALGWNNMQVTRLLFHAGRNEQTTENEFVTLARQVFRLRQLEHIASDKVRSLSAASSRIDEIEVYLAYQTRLKEALSLPDILTSAMNFGTLADVTEEDINIALEAVQHAEERGFRSWLNNWEPCQQFLLKRISADEQEVLAEQRITVFDEQLQHFRQAFSDAGSGTDVDRVLGVRATEATNDIIFGPLTGQMFRV